MAQLLEFSFLYPGCPKDYLEQLCSAASLERLEGSSPPPSSERLFHEAVTEKARAWTVAQ